MILATVAAGALLATLDQPRPLGPQPFTGKSVCQWVLAPGGITVPMPTPFVVFVALRWVPPVPSLPKRQWVEKEWSDFQIVITSRGLDKAMAEGAVAPEVELPKVAEKTVSADSRSLCAKSKAESKAVIDPVVTGF